uniref:Ig-like domain-containing protein n=1 Tax=Nothobranchius furzeri TaxID=105023 RepID=A0A8C6VVR1_NOTFU
TINTFEPPEVVTPPDETPQITCRHFVDSFNTILWYKQSNRVMQLLGYRIMDSEFLENGVNVKTGGSTNKGEKCTLTIRELTSSAVFSTDQVHWDSGVNEAYFGAGTRLTVLGRSPTTPTVEVFKPSAKECNDPNKKRKKTLVCVASGFYPDHVSVSWMLNGVQTGKGVATDSTAKRDGDSYRITSRLKVQAKDWFRPGNRFTCTVKYSFSDLPTEKYLRITQNAKLFYVVLIVKSCIYGAFVCFLVWKLQVCQQPPYELNFQAAKMSL